MSTNKFKILALDGGGIRGVVTARILQEVEKQVGKPLNQYFDLITGTSTGSILAAGLVIGLSPTALIKIYQDEGGKIFLPSLKKNILRWFQGPKYSNEGLKSVLIEHLGDVKFGQVSARSAKAKLLILAYDTLYRNTTFFISHLPEDQQRWYYDVNLWEVCLSSASAPTFFPPHEFAWKDSQDPKGKVWKFPHVDGGVSANNPSLAALGHVLGVEERLVDAEQQKWERVKLEDIAILSVGTGKTTEPIEYSQAKGWGMLSWAQQIPNVFMGGQLQIFSDLCRQIVTSANPKGYLRLQYELNSRFQRNSLSGMSEFLPPEKQVNEYTKTKVSEAMDDASKDNINQLINTTDAFLNSRDYKEVDGEWLTVKESIAQFLEDNS